MKPIKPTSAVVKKTKSNPIKQTPVVKKTKSNPIKQTPVVKKTTISQFKNVTSKETPKETTVEKGDDINYGEIHFLSEDYKTNGCTKFLQGIFILTPHLRNQVGSVWNGFAFILQTNGTNSLKNGGGFLGYDRMENGVIAIEFDTFHNSDFGDPSSQHISIQIPDANGCLSVNHRFSLACQSFLYPIDNGIDRSVDIIYNSKSLSITILIDKVTILSQVKFSKPLPKYAYYGFTSGTGDCFQTHTIKSCKFTSVLSQMEE
ncbi:hypothetical protein RB653_002241 [Dictyostelium firmibasis]|uniref:Legume lectin domain-containing protein n=1 Tax=Dictyostelium firmibasis TaxID=79012 RepID=A0AAN7TY47_9MYCE